MNKIIAVLTLMFFAYAMYLQCFNLAKYKNTNGVLTHRLTILAILIVQTVHTIRFFSSDEPLFFMFVSGLLFVKLYHGFDKLVKKTPKE